MSQGQPVRPQQGRLEQPQNLQGQVDQEPIKYGDIFNVSGELSAKPVVPEDANMMQTVETMVYGQTQKGRAATSMQSAATRNERSGFVSHYEATHIVNEELGAIVTEIDVPGTSMVTERVAGQLVGQYVEATLVQGLVAGSVQNAVTIGEALEAAAQTVGNKPVDQSDAAAIQAAEVRATGSNVAIPGGLAAQAQSAASYNAEVNT